MRQILKKIAIPFLGGVASLILILHYENCVANTPYGPTSVTTSASDLPSTFTAAINCGSGGAYYSPTSGISWNADEYYSGGGPVLNSQQSINPPGGDGEVYQSNRNGNMTYNIPVSNGTHQVILKFAEYYWNSANSRLFNVTINGTEELMNFDIFATAGGQYVAVDETFIVTVTTGSVDIVFQTLKDNAQINGILIY